MPSPTQGKYLAGQRKESERELRPDSVCGVRVIQNGPPSVFPVGLNSRDKTYIRTVCLKIEYPRLEHLMSAARIFIFSAS